MADEKIAVELSPKTLEILRRLLREELQHRGFKVRK